jgi:formate dehydrogenase major subunit
VGSSGRARRRIIPVRRGCTRVPIAISERVRDGELFATFHTGEVLLNRLIGSFGDAITHTPEYKVTAVRIELLGSGAP